MGLAQLLVIVIVLQALLRPLMAAWWFTRPPRLRVTYRTPADWGAAYEDVTFTGSGETRLAGWYVPSRNGAAVILLHGHSGNRLAVAYHAEALTQAGYGVLMFDLRAHGDSGGRRFVRGAEAVDDVLAAVAWVARRRDVQGRIGVMGISAGGMLALQAAARNAYIRAAAADGPILGTIDDLPPPADWLDRLWRYPQERYYQAVIDRITRSPRPMSNIAALQRLAGRPVLLISAGRGLEQRLTRHLYTAAGEPKRLWEIPRAAHATGWAAEPEAYAAEMLAFFDRALSVHSPEAPAAPSPPDSLPAATPAAQEPAIDRVQATGERTIAMPTAMMIAFATIPLAMMGLFIPFQLRWGAAPPRLPADRPVATLLGVPALMLAGLWLHEFVHLAAYYTIGRVPRGAVRLGGGPGGFAPRVRWDTAVTARTLRMILILPALVLGALPGIAGIIWGSWLLIIWAVWMVAASGGDLAILWAMRDLPPGALVRLHPTRPGCEVLTG